MRVKCDEIVIEEIDGNRFPDLKAVQRMALRPLAFDLAATLRILLANEFLEIDNGSIILKRKEKIGP